MARRILIVEDEPAFAEVLAELLVDEGYSVLCVGDAVSALNLLSAGPRRQLDMVICDVMLPGLRGDRFAAEVRKRYPTRRLPILLMSASAAPVLGLPEVAFMAKPFDSDDLLQRLEDMLSQAARPGVVPAS